MAWCLQHSNLRRNFKEQWYMNVMQRATVKKVVNTETCSLRSQTFGHVCIDFFLLFKLQDPYANYSESPLSVRHFPVKISSLSQTVQKLQQFKDFRLVTLFVTVFNQYFSSILSSFQSPACPASYLTLWKNSRLNLKYASRDNGVVSSTLKSPQEF